MKVLIVGTGSMANYHATKYNETEGVEVVAAIDINQERLDTFCNKHNIAKQFTSVEDAISWNEFDSASVVTPDPHHKDPSIKLLNAKKHVLCEKPLAPNYADANEMTKTAKQAGTVAMVHLTYRESAALNKAHELTAKGALGNIKHVQADYRQSWLAQDAWGDWQTEETWLWRLSSKHGSLGVLGDIGIHLLDFACHATNETVTEVSGMLKTFDKAPNNQIGEYVLDANDSVVLTTSLANGAVAVFQASRYMTGYINDIKLNVFGDKGALAIDYSNTNTHDILRTCLGDDIKTGTWQEEKLDKQPSTITRFINAVTKQDKPEPSFIRASQMQKVIDAAFVSNEQNKIIKV